MKPLGLIAIALFLSACSSSMDVIDAEAMGCGAGNPLEIRAGLDRRIGEGQFGEQFELLVEVANNSHGDTTVKAVRVEQLGGERAYYQFDPTTRSFDELIEEGKDHVFHLPMNARPTRPRRDDVTSSSSSALELAVTVVTADGDSYRCVFDVAR